MSSVNKVILVGRLGKDPEMRYLPDGTAACNFSLATSESWKDKNTGEKREETEWHRVTCMGKLAEVAGKYLKKGSSAYVEGRLRTRKWTDNNGQERYSTEIKMDELVMLGGASGNQQAGGAGSAGQSGGQAQQQRPAQRPAQPSAMNGDFDDDIPF